MYEIDYFGLTRRQPDFVVDYYNRAGRAVYACAMDLSKAFDLVS